MSERWNIYRHLTNATGAPVVRWLQHDWGTAVSWTSRRSLALVFDAAGLVAITMRLEDTYPGCRSIPVERTLFDWIHGVT